MTILVDLSHTDSQCHSRRSPKSRWCRHWNTKLDIQLPVPLMCVIWCVVWICLVCLFTSHIRVVSSRFAGMTIMRQRQPEPNTAMTTTTNDSGDDRHSQKRKTNRCIVHSQAQVCWMNGCGCVTVCGMPTGCEGIAHSHRSLWLWFVCWKYISCSQLQIAHALVVSFHCSISTNEWPSVERGGGGARTTEIFAGLKWLPVNSGYRLPCIWWQRIMFNTDFSLVMKFKTVFHASERKTEKNQPTAAIRFRRINLHQRDQRASTCHLNFWVKVCSTSSTNCGVFDRLAVSIGAKYR